MVAKSISHHLSKPWLNPLFLVFTVIIQGFLRWCEMDFVHPLYEGGGDSFQVFPALDPKTSCFGQLIVRVCLVSLGCKVPANSAQTKSPLVALDQFSWFFSDAKLSPNTDLLSWYVENTACLVGMLVCLVGWLCMVFLFLS